MHGTYYVCKSSKALVLWATLLVGLSSVVGQEAKIDQTESVKIVGRVVDSESSGVASARVMVQYRQSNEMAHASTTTDATGNFRIEFNSRAGSFWKISARSNDESQMGFFRYDPSKMTSNASEVEIKLEPTQSHVVDVLNSDGKPVGGAQVVFELGYPHSITGLSTNEGGRVEVNVPQSERIQSVMAWKDGVGFDYKVYALGRNQQADLKTAVPEIPKDGETLRLEGADTVTVKVVDASGEPVEGVRLYPWILQKESSVNDVNLSSFADVFSQRTDALGKATFAWMPTWQKSIVTLWPTAEGYTQTRGQYDPALEKGEATITLEKPVAIRGLVLDEKGKPAAGISVFTTGSGYGWDHGRDQSTTAADGKYEFLVPPEQIYMVTIEDDTWVADAVPSFVVNSGKPVEGINLTLRKPTRVTGQLKAEPSGEPIKNERVIVYQYGDSLDSIKGAVIANPEKSRRYVQPTTQKVTRTDEEGRFEFLLGNGSYDIRPPRQEKADEFNVSGEDTLTMDVTTEIQSKIKLDGMVRHKEDDRPLAGIRLSGVSQQHRGDDWEARTDESGAFAVERLGEPTYVYATNDDKSLGAVAILKADQDKLEMQLMPTGSAHGVLHQTDSETPSPKTRVLFGIRVPDENNSTWSNRFGGVAVTDAEGRFELEGLVSGWEYQLSLDPRPEGTIPSLKSVTVDSGQRVDMGTQAIPAAPKPYVPPTLDERIAYAMNVAGSAKDRFERGIVRCKLNKQKLLIVIGKPDDDRLRQFMKLQYQDKDYRKIRDDLLVMALSTADPEKTKSAGELLEALGSGSLARSTTDAGAETAEKDLGAGSLARSTTGEGAEEALQFSLVLVGSDGALIEQRTGDELVEDEKLSKEVVIQWLRSHIDEPIDARKLLDATLAQAKKENKRVLVQETATWCGPCHMLSDFLNSHREWEADYIWIKMDHRFSGAEEIMDGLREGAEGGIPWCVILDADGKKLATSNHYESGENIGFPSSEEGLAHFKRMLLDTRISMTEEQIDSFIAHRKKND